MPDDVVPSPEGKAFVEEVMRRVGAENPTELSTVLGEEWAGRSALRKLYKWHKGGAAPNFQGTLALLRAGGYLKEDAKALVPTQRLAPASGDPLVELKGAVDATLDVVLDVQERLERVELRLPPAEPQPAAEDRGTTRKKRVR